MHEDLGQCASVKRAGRPTPDGALNCPGPGWPVEDRSQCPGQEEVGVVGLEELITSIEGIVIRGLERAPEARWLVAGG